jgi:alkyl sulfatase BDS1-like metallo-beta-lactamase superfamily hydrolase
MAQLNRVHGLFKVTERIFQVCGFWLANITFVEGEAGLIVIDPLTFEEHAQVALELYFQHRGRRAIKAIVYTHSHRDHYGGVKGIVSPQQVRAEVIPVIAPFGFTEEAFSETMLAGVAMRRRSLYQFGTSLPAGPKAHVDSGLGKAVGRGTDGFIAPTLLISRPVERHVIDGVIIDFQLTPGAEAPAEMNLFFPELRALNLAENACHTMHNLCPLRGAKTRYALAWARYLDDALHSFVPQADVVFAQHHWPVWGESRVAVYVAGQRDLYRYLHDQTLRLMSHDLSPGSFDLGSAAVKRRLGNDVAAYLAKMQKRIQTEFGSLERSPEFLIGVEYKLVLTKKPGEADIVLSSGDKGKSANIVQIAKDPGASHPYRQKELLVALDAALNGLAVAN